MPRLLKHCPKVVVRSDVLRLEVDSHGELMHGFVCPLLTYVEHTKIHVGHAALVSLRRMGRIPGVLECRATI